MRAVLLLVAIGCSRAHVPVPVPAPDPPATRTIDDDIDRLLRESWDAAKVTPAPAADDAEFLRRVTLDLAGRVPTLEEARSFLAKPDRASLVDRLLASDDAAEHFGRSTASLLLDEALGGVPSQRRERAVEVLARWLADAYRAGTSWDRIVTSLVAQAGDSEEHPEVLYVALAGRAGSLETVAGQTARVFLGVQLQCAQCHDHPYDARWKQEDFWGFAAYFARTRARRDPDADGLRGLHVLDVPRGQARMERPGSTAAVVVKPRFFGRDVPHAKGEARRPVLARAIVASDLFAKAAVNRAWTRFFGRGLVDPWDDLGGEHDPSHPALLVRLAGDFRAHGHDVKRLHRTIVLSDAYARSSRGGAGPPDDPALPERIFARAAVRPLAGDPLFDSLVTATGIEGAPGLRAARRQIEYVFSDDEMAAVDGFDGTVPQALLLLNGELLNRAAAARQGTLAAILAASTSTPERIDAMYLAAFARRPTDEERRARIAWIEAEGSRRGAWQDLWFAMMTSSEFTTNH